MSRPKDALGNPITAPTFLYAGAQGRLRGYPLSCAVNGVAILDIEVTSQLLVQGGAFWMSNTVFGDKAHFAIVDKNDVLGLHTANSIPLGTPIELVRYVQDYQPPTTGLWDDDIIMPTVAPVAPGLFLRMIYEAANSGLQRDMSVLYYWYIGG